MFRRQVLLSVFSSALALTCACSSDSSNDCNDGADNDGDGLVDEQDPGCALNGDLEAARGQVDELERGIRNLHASLESERRELREPRARTSPDISDLLRDGVAIDLLFRTAEDELTDDTRRRLV